MITKTVLAGSFGIAALAGMTIPAAAQDQAQNAPAVIAEASPAPAEKPVPTKIPEGYGLVWSDEFDAPGLPDPSKWQYDTFRNKDGWFNNEKQYYAAEREKNARVADGRLVIEAHSEDLSQAGFADWGKQQYLVGKADYARAWRLDLRLFRNPGQASLRAGNMASHLDAAVRSKRKMASRR